MSFPYLDVAGFTLRTVMPATDVATLVALEPGWFEQQEEDIASQINSQMRKRYGQSANGNSLPFGQRPPVLVASGTAPPGVLLLGRPVLGSMKMLLKITTGGPVGTAIFSWSPDNGVTTTAGVVTGPLVVLGATGLSAQFSVGVYGTDNVYVAATPVPGTVLRWLTWLLTLAMYDKRGRNPQDGGLVTVQARADQAIAELKAAADSKDGLWDLPVSEDLDTAVTTGGPLGYFECSPYVWMDQQRRIGTQQDTNGNGSST